MLERILNSLDGPSHQQDSSIFTKNWCIKMMMTRFSFLFQTANAGNRVLGMFYLSEMMDRRDVLHWAELIMRITVRWYCFQDKNSHCGTVANHR